MYEYLFDKNMTNVSRLIQVLLGLLVPFIKIVAVTNAINCKPDGRKGLSIPAIIKMGGFSPSSLSFS